LGDWGLGIWVLGVVGGGGSPKTTTQNTTKKHPKNIFFIKNKKIEI